MRRLILAAVVCMAGSSVIAQNTAPTAAGDFLFDSKSHIRLGKGDVTWTAAASLIAPMGINKGSENKGQVANAYAALGYFLVDQFELEGCTTYIKAGDLQGVSVEAGVNMYFREFFDKWYPYAGIGVSQWFSDLSDQGTHFLAKVGARYYFTDSLGLRLWVEYDAGKNILYNSTGTVTAYVGVFSMAY